MKAYGRRGWLKHLANQVNAWTQKDIFRQRRRYSQNVGQRKDVAQPARLMKSKNS